MFGMWKQIIPTEVYRIVNICFTISALRFKVLESLYEQLPYRNTRFGVKLIIILTFDQGPVFHLAMHIPL